MVTAMPGETDLEAILSNLSPILLPETWVFCTLPDASYGDFAETIPKAAILEQEGLTLVLEKHIADQYGFSYGGEWRCISLQVHSSLNAVGLTAAISGALADQHISVNIIAGYHHDHLFVPEACAGRALELLAELQQSQPS